MGAQLRNDFSDHWILHSRYWFWILDLGELKMGYIVLFLGGIIGSVPTMVYQVWNGASLIGVMLSVAGGWMLVKGATSA